MEKSRILTSNNKPTTGESRRREEMYIIEDSNINAHKKTQC